MANKLKNILIIVSLLVTVIFTGIASPVQAAGNKTVHIAYYLTDDQENYINWDGDRIDSQQRILLYEETRQNLGNGAYVLSQRQFTNSNGVTLYPAIGGKQVAYNQTDHCEMMFGYYMDNTVTYMDWNNAVDQQYVMVDSKPVRFPYNFDYETSTPSINGYTFIGWLDEDGYQYGRDSIIKKDVVVYARYVKNEDKKEYTVNHYVETLDGKYIVYDSEQKSAENKEEVLASSLVKTGLTGFSFNALMSDHSIIVGQNQTINLYYDRNIKTVTFMNGEVIDSVVNVKYEGKASIPQTPVKEGYKFVKWNTSPDGTGKDFNAEDTITYDIVYYAIFEAVPAYSYTVEYYQAENDGYHLQRDEMKTAYQGTMISASSDEKNQYPGYSFNEDKSDKAVEIIQEGQTIRYYYDKVQYPYTIQYYYDGVLEDSLTEHKSAYLNTVITEYSDKNKEGFQLNNQPSLTISEDENILKVEYVRQTFEVRFLDQNGQVIKTESVKYGDAATAPNVEAESGKYFIGWDRAFDHVVENLDVTVQFGNTYWVEFQDMNGNLLSKAEVKQGEDAPLPTVPVVEGYEFIGWDGNYQNIQEDSIVKAQYRKLDDAVVPPVDVPDDTVPPAQPPVDVPSDTIPPVQPPQQNPNDLVPPADTPNTGTIVPEVPEITIVPNQTIEAPVNDSQQTLPVTIVEQQQTPLALGDNTLANGEQATEEISESQTPQSNGGNVQHWAVVNLIAAGLTIVLTVVLLLSKKEKEENDENEESKKRRTWTKVASVCLSIISVVIFMFTENIFLAMTWVDPYTFIMLVLCIVQLFMLYIGRRYKDNNDTRETVVS